MDDTNPILDLKFLPLSHLEITESEVEVESSHLDSLPLCFNTFQIMKGNWDQILADNHKRKHELSKEPTLPYKAPHDRISDVLDGFFFQSQSPCVHNALKSYYDMDMIRKSSPLYDSIEVVAQHLIDSMQTCFELIEDHENTSVVAGYEAE